MKKLPISRFPLEMAFDNSSWEMSYYLDLETRELVLEELQQDV